MNNSLYSESRSGTHCYRAFVLFCVAAACYWFTENSVDPDLWGHVIYGQRNLALHSIERTEPFS